MQQSTPIRRRDVLRLSLVAMALGLASACNIAIPPLRLAPRSVPTRAVSVLAAHAGSPDAGEPAPLWLSPVQAAVEAMNAANRGGADTPLLDLAVFTADHAPAARLTPTNGMVGLDADVYMAALVQRLAESVDVLLIDTTRPLAVVRQLERHGALVPLASSLAEAQRRRPLDYYPEALALGRVRGRQLALPLAVLPQLLRFDAVLFRAAGLTPPPSDRPQTWRQFIDSASALVRRPATDGAVPQWGCSVLSLAPEIPIWQAGGEVVAANGDVVVDQPAAIQGVTFWQDLVTRYHLIALGRRGPPVARDPARLYAITAWGGLAATTFATPLDSYTANLMEVGLHWDEGTGFAPIPAGPPGGTLQVTKLQLGLAGCLSASSRQPDRAFAALQGLEATAGPSLLVSGRRSLARRLLEQGGIDHRLASAIGWGMETGRASVLDQIAPGTLLNDNFLRVFPGWAPTTVSPTVACEEAARALRAELADNIR